MSKKVDNACLDMANELTSDAFTQWLFSTRATGDYTIHTSTKITREKRPTTRRTQTCVHATDALRRNKTVAGRINTTNKREPSEEMDTDAPLAVFNAPTVATHTVEPGKKMEMELHMQLFLRLM